MRSVVFIFILLSVASFCDENFNSKTRKFSVDLLYHTLQEYSDRDVVMSPYIIWSLLMSMAYESLGLAWEEIPKVFSLTKDRNEGVQQFKSLRKAVLVNESWRLESRNFLFYDEGFDVYSDSIRRLENDFAFIARRLKFDNAESAAFRASKTLRSGYPPYAYHKSIVRAEDFVNTTMIMCNILSFTGPWLYPFNTAGTRMEHEYYFDDYEARRADIMTMRAPLRFSNFEALNASVTEVPYSGDGSYCMLLVRPYDGYRLDHLLANLREVSLKDILDKLQSDVDKFGLKEVEVKLPSYGRTSYLVLNKPLLNMGLSDVFDPNVANFSFAKDNTYIGEIVHRVSFILTETATIVQATTPGYELNKTRIVKKLPVKEPFIFFIIEKTTATVLFSGSYRYFDFIRRIREWL